LYVSSVSVRLGREGPKTRARRGGEGRGVGIVSRAGGGVRGEVQVPALHGRTDSHSFRLFGQVHERETSAGVTDSQMRLLKATKRCGWGTGITPPDTSGTPELALCWTFILPSMDLQSQTRPGQGPDACQRLY
jgi:hypothetical protein